MLCYAVSCCAVLCCAVVAIHTNTASLLQHSTAMVGMRLLSQLRKPMYYQGLNYRKLPWQLQNSTDVLPLWTCCNGAFNTGAMWCTFQKEGVVAGGGGGADV